MPLLSHLAALVLLKEEIMTRPSSSTSMLSREKSSIIWRMILPPGPMIFSRDEGWTQKTSRTQSRRQHKKNVL